MTKKPVLYNASDFPLSLKLTLQPNAGIKLEHLLELIREHGEYVYLADTPQMVDENRVLHKEKLQISFD